MVIDYDGDEDDTDTFLLGSREVLGTEIATDAGVFSGRDHLITFSRIAAPA